MTRKEAIALVSNLPLTANDKKAFTQFQPLGKIMEEHKGQVLMATGHDFREILGEKYLQLNLAPETGKGPNVSVTLAYDSRSIFTTLEGETEAKSLRDIGRETDHDVAIGKLAAFTVDSVEFTGEYPWKRSKAAETLKMTDIENEDMKQGDWNRLSDLYKSSADMRGPAEDVNEIFQITKTFITPVGA